MNLQKMFIMTWAILILILLISQPSFSQVKKGQTITFPGVIENISFDFKYIIVNETKISIDSGTQITDDKGSGLSPYDLKPNSFITIGVLQNSNGFFAKKIMVNAQKRNL